MKKLLLTLFCILASATLLQAKAKQSIPKTITISKARLLDKIKGGWAAQTIGCTYGGPTEFCYRSQMIPDSVDIAWPDGQIKWYYDRIPTLYDDVYMDLTFVDVMERYGIDAPVDSFATAFAYADYYLWHANQAARYNIINGILPPASGHWTNNPHSDDIDFQIEADFAGLMTPGMPNACSEICDKIGHIMNYGDGWYGGVYVAAMYSLAFVSDDLEFIVSEALKTIPKKSRFYRCISDVIDFYHQHPADWKLAWQQIERKWNRDYGCPEGVETPLNIEALVNSAYVVIGLLYGEGDFHRTMEIATRCGQDSDCNPATAAGILATVKGYSWIPEKWMKNLREVEERDFAYTTMSLSKTYDTSFRHALEMIGRGGGSVEGETVTIRCQKPRSVRLEQGFEGMRPAGREAIGKSIREMEEWEIDGVGCVFVGSVKSDKGAYTAEVEMYVDGQLVETAQLPTGKRHRVDLFWRYQMPPGRHVFTFRWLNPEEGKDVRFDEAVLYVKN